jgi:hypothetical protein
MSKTALTDIRAPLTHPTWDVSKIVANNSHSVPAVKLPVLTYAKSQKNDTTMAAPTTIKGLAFANQHTNTAIDRSSAHKIN